MKRCARLIVMALVVAACDDSSATIPVIDATTAVGGVVYLDVDGSETLTARDLPVEGGIVILTSPGSGQVLAADTSLSSGEYLMEDVPVGTVDIAADSSFLADSLLQVPLDTTRYSLTADEPLARSIGVTFPQRSVRETRDETAGITIFTQGVVLNARGQAPGGAIHVEGPDATIRVLVPPAVQPSVGDSVRVQGRTAVELGQPVLQNGRLFGLVAGARDVVPQTITLDQAESADGGELDAALVAVTEGTVVTQDTIPEGIRLRVAPVLARSGKIPCCS